MFAARAHAGGLSPRSVQRRLSAVRGFFNYLVRERVVASNPAVDMRAPEGGADACPARSMSTSSTSCSTFRAEDALAVRDRAIMELFYSSGLRLDELVGLDIAQLDLADRTVRVLGKGRKTRIVPVGRKAIEALRVWLRERAALAGTGEDGVVRRQERRAAEASRRSSCASRTGRGARACRRTSIRTCSAIHSPRICLNRVRICAACRSCSATPTSPPRRSTPTLISPTWPAPTTLPTLGQNARRRS